MKFIPPEELPTHWLFVESGLRKVLELTNEPWSPTDVKHHLYEGWATLFVCEDGFVILQRLKAQWTSEPYLNVWVMWFHPGKAKAKRQELIEWLDEMARQFRCNWWEFSSPREGWAGIEGDCERVRTIWRRK